ncbi:uncharacterized protein LOC8036370 isoform X3 [Ixodes scapularis]|uniref:uncharacterized protein LOC8036370 isoform X3 n=1 Tax=Ixodes scapularis TaxID=6945 RepID=UPI001C38DE4C|nr:uncharacterized protein LOC8036370 isoform X3 [Ixodes scapularis]
MPQDCAFGNCKNVAKSGSGCRFFCFPSERLQRKRRKLWIAAVAAVNRTNEDGTPWLPHSNSRVCSAHFMTGKPSRYATHPDFVPRILNIPVAGARDHGPSGVPALQDCDHSHSLSPETDWSRDEERHAAAGPSGVPALQDCDHSHSLSPETDWSQDEERHAAAGSPPALFHDSSPDWAPSVRMGSPGDRNPCKSRSYSRLQGTREAAEKRPRPSPDKNAAGADNVDEPTKEDNSLEMRPTPETLRHLKENLQKHLLKLKRKQKRPVTM